MTDRRTLLQGSLSGNSATGVNSAAANPDMAMASNSGNIPDVMVMTHEGQMAKFYSELISDQIVLINFMSIKRETKFPISKKMAAIASKLGDRMGRDVQIISITSDPENDTPERLAAFHQKMGGIKGWTFVRTSPGSNDLLAHRFYRHGRDVSLGGRMDIVQYGNAKVGTWAAFPWDINVEDAAGRIDWVTPRDIAQGEMRRAGPRPLGSEGQRWNNRQA